MFEWLERRSGGQRKSEDGLSFAARVDRGRITHSAAFRRLQGKTQVFGLDNGDFFRTRLTHSLEVAQIGARLAQRLFWLTHNVERYAPIKEWVPPEHLIESACLAHDIGHPPFGHNGEKVLNYFMVPHGGFEGNGQTLRLLSRLGEYSDGFGHDLARRTLLAVIKYPAPFSHFNLAYPDYKEPMPRNIDAWHPPKCIHDSEMDVLDWLLLPFSDDDKSLFVAMDRDKGGKNINGEKVGKTRFKSLDCTIMELADDIAYGVHDLEDAISIGLLPAEQVTSELRDLLCQIAESEKKSRDPDYYICRLNSKEPRQVKQAITNIVNFLVNNTEVVEMDCFEHPLLRLQMRLKDDAAAILEQLKRYVFKSVIGTPKMRTLEHKGQRVISELFATLRDNAHALMPQELITDEILENETLLHRCICDYIASMTDSEATAMFERLFLPGTGSIFEPL